MYAHREVIETISQYEKIYEYRNDKGNKITNSNTIEYIKSLKIPPAYENVKIDLNKNAKLLVTGYDVKGKKQYIYNPRWVEMRSIKKFCNMIEFGNKLPQIKNDIDKSTKSLDDNETNIINILTNINQFINSFKNPPNINSEWVSVSCDDCWDIEQYNKACINRKNIKSQIKKSQEMEQPFTLKLMDIENNIKKLNDEIELVYNFKNKIMSVSISS